MLNAQQVPLFYFDNYEAGNRDIKIIKNEKNEAKDCRILYLNY